MPSDERGEDARLVRDELADDRAVEVVAAVGARRLDRALEQFAHRAAQRRGAGVGVADVVERALLLGRGRVRRARRAGTRLRELQQPPRLAHRHRLQPLRLALERAGARQLAGQPPAGAPEQAADPGRGDDRAAGRGHDLRGLHLDTRDRALRRRAERAGVGDGREFPAGRLFASAGDAPSGLGRGRSGGSLTTDRVRGTRMAA